MAIETKAEKATGNTIRPKALSNKISNEKNVRLDKFFGVIKLKEDAVALQIRWRDEW